MRANTTEQRCRRRAVGEQRRDDAALQAPPKDDDRRVDRREQKESRRRQPVGGEVPPAAEGERYRRRRGDQGDHDVESGEDGPQRERSCGLDARPRHQLQARRPQAGQQPGARRDHGAADETPEVDRWRARAGAREALIVEPASQRIAARRRDQDQGGEPDAAARRRLRWTAASVQAQKHGSENQRQDVAKLVGVAGKADTGDQRDAMTGRGPRHQPLIGERRFEAVSSRRFARPPSIPSPLLSKVSSGRECSIPLNLRRHHPKRLHSGSRLRRIVGRDVTGMGRAA
jgi:hypothetical protein